MKNLGAPNIWVNGFVSEAYPRVYTVCMCHSYVWVSDDTDFGSDMSKARMYIAEIPNHYIVCLGLKFNCVF